MSQVQIESPFQRRRRRQARHKKLHPKFPAPSRDTGTAGVGAVMPKVTARTIMRTAPVRTRPAMPPSENPTLKLSIDLLGLDAPVVSALKWKGVPTIGELADQTEAELRRKGFLSPAIGQIKTRLAARNLALRSE